MGGVREESGPDHRQRQRKKLHESRLGSQRRRPARGFFVAATAAANFTLPTAVRTVLSGGIIAAVARSTMVETRASH